MSSLTGRTLGRYQLLDRIGQGGMATVYKAYDPVQDRDVALKVLNPALAQQEAFGGRFRREANVVVQLRHPHIVPVNDFGDKDGYTYLVMPYLRAGSFADRLEHGPLTLAEAARVLDQVAGALDYAHQRGVVHRDLKPSNILINEQGDALLADFGLAHIHDTSHSLTGSALIGTPAYISPEQARGEKVDHRSDQYSLGVILYQLSTGQLPYEGDTPMAVLIKQIHEPLPLPQEVNPQVPDSVQRVILKATAKDPDHRFLSVADMNVAFQAALAHALDPAAHPAPEVPLPAALDPTRVMGAHGARPAFWRGRWIRAASVGMLLVLLLLALPVSASSLTALLQGAGSPAESSGLSIADMNDAQLTALAGTIEAMSTELARSQGSALAADQIQTAVMETLTVADDTGGDGGDSGLNDAPSETPSATGGGADGTPPGYSSPTLTQTPGLSPTSRRTPTHTRSPTPGPSSMPTRTPTLAPSATPGVSPTPTPSTAASNTPTTIPSPTSTPTNTSLPPTPTSTPSGSGDVCSTSSLSGFSVSGKNTTWTLTNGGSSTIEITETTINWPSSNEELFKVYLGGSLIWDETDGSPPTTLGNDWEGGSRVLYQGESKPLKFEFDVNAAASGYSLTVTLNDDCQLSAGG